MHDVLVGKPRLLMTLAGAPTAGTAPTVTNPTMRTTDEVGNADANHKTLVRDDVFFFLVQSRSHTETF